MLFVVTHTHTAESCPAGHPEALHQVASPEHAKESGVKVVGAYIAPAEHTQYFILESDELGAVVRFLRPLMSIGGHRITPVQTFQEALGAHTVQRPRRRTRRQG